MSDKRFRGRVITWLRNYAENGMTWRELSEETMACWRIAFQKEFPGASVDVLLEAHAWLERKYGKLE